MTRLPNDQGQVDRSGDVAGEYPVGDCGAARADSVTRRDLPAASSVRLRKLNMKVDSLLTKVTPVLLAAAIIGGIRVHADVARLQQETTDIKTRIARIEQLLDSGARYGMLEVP